MFTISEECEIRAGDHSNCNIQAGAGEAIKLLHLERERLEGNASRSNVLLMK